MSIQFRFLWITCTSATVGLLTPLALQPAYARNDVARHSIQRAIEMNGQKANLRDMPMYFGPMRAPAGTDLGEITTSNKTSALGKSDAEACFWVFMSALKSLQGAALKRGANAIVNVRSNYEHNEFSSDSEFECGAGTLMAGVALKATAVRLESPGAAPTPPPPAAAPAPRQAKSPAAQPVAQPTKPQPIDSLGSLSAGPAETDQLTTARRHFEKGQRLYDLRRYADSIPEFEKAYELSGDAVLLYNLGQAYRMAEKYPDALHYYRAFLKKVPKSSRTELVRKRIAELEATQQPPNSVDEPESKK